MEWGPRVVNGVGTKGSEWSGDHRVVNGVGTRGS